MWFEISYSEIYQWKKISFNNNKRDETLNHPHSLKDPLVIDLHVKRHFSSDSLILDLFQFPLQHFRLIFQEFLQNWNLNF